MAKVGPIALAFNKNTGVPTSSEKKYSLTAQVERFQSSDKTLNVAAASLITPSNSKNNCE